MKKNNRNKKKPEKISFSHSEAASSTVIGTVLLLGIIFSIFSIVWIGYVPEWKSDAESSHMDDVYKDMADVKSKIDMMSTVLASNPNSSYITSSEPSSSFPQLVMSVPFHMGGGDVPIIGPMKSSGILAVNKDRCIMNISVDTSPYYFNTINCSTITYNSQNRYYVDQAFSYEGGALILDQNDQSVMTLYPSIRFSRNATNGYNVSINAVRIFQKPYNLPRTISSNKDCSLRLTGLDYKPLYNKGSISKFELTINTTHPAAWKQYLKKALREANIDAYSLTEPNGLVSLNFPTDGRGVNRLYVSETVVKAEPGIGLN